MVAASFFSLLLPALEASADLGRWAFLPSVAGFSFGMLFLLLLDRVIPHLYMNAEKAEGPHCRAKKTTMMVLAVTLHNIPEGLAVGVVDNGKIAQTGTHDELMKEDGIYRRFVEGRREAVSWKIGSKA